MLFSLDYLSGSAMTICIIAELCVIAFLIESITSTKSMSHEQL